MPAKTELTDQEFVENIVKAIVDHPEEVVTGRTLDERGVLIQLTVNREDMGKVIGREGRTAKAIRSLLRVFGARNESRINLKIVDPEGGSADIPEEHGDKPMPAKKPESTEPVEKPVKEIEKADEAHIAEISTEKPIDSSAEASAQVEEKATGVF
ncbi:MAG: KH domain-containing protein [bacterium]|nr:KH domain-containing protein [bacterium]